MVVDMSHKPTYHWLSRSSNLTDVIYFSMWIQQDIHIDNQVDVLQDDSILVSKQPEQQCRVRLFILILAEPWISTLPCSSFSTFCLIPNDRQSMSEHKSKKPASTKEKKQHDSMRSHWHHLLYTIDTAFKQQRLKAWQPLLTPKTVLPTLFAVGIVFAPLGGLFLYESETVKDAASALFRVNVNTNCSLLRSMRLLSTIPTASRWTRQLFLLQTTFTATSLPQRIQLVMMDCILLKRERIKWMISSH